MNITPQTAWLLAISAVVIVGIIAFFVGRKTAGTKDRIDELEAELERKQEEVAGYRKDVEAHFDKTATLFVSMAGSYKALFEHLSTDYEKLSTGSARELFQQRVDALLIGAGRGADEGSEAGKLLGAGAAATAAAGAATESGAETAPTETAEPAQASEPATEGRAEPEAPSDSTADTGSQGAAPAAQPDSEKAAATGTDELEQAAAEGSDERKRKEEGVAVDPTVDEGAARGEAPRNERS
ncbi:MAG: DUF1043 family protein [Thauera sp.]